MYVCMYVCMAVAGPVTGLIATLKRIKWEMPSALEAVDDLGQSWFFNLDSPAAIVKACEASVRRWRLDRVCKAIAGLDPGRIDVPHKIGDRSLLVDFAAAVNPLVRGKSCKTPKDCIWERKWGAMLASAMNGGQWPQARKAQVAAFGTTSSLCQLCFKEVGTLQHRAVCEATRPEGGWPPPPKAAELARSKLGDTRKRLLDTRGLAVFRITAPPIRQDGALHWQRQPDLNDPAVDEATWYFDGSMQEGKLEPLRATGFGLAVVSPNGDLLGAARGTPPQWCSTAAAAEAWALLEVLRQSPTPPRMKTDCLSLLSMARQGAEAATAANRPLARIFVEIARALDGDLTTLERTNLLVWQPAHQTVQAIGQRHGSDGKKITTADWRANRLVDALAKQAAEQVRADKATRDLLQSGRAASLHAACTLGRITFAANNHKVETTGLDGVVHTVTQRDSQDAPPRRFKPAASGKEALPAVVRETKSKKRPLAPRVLKDEPDRKKPCANARFKAQRAQADKAVLQRVVEERTSQLSRSSAEPAAQIMERLRKRVRLRCIEPPPDY
jgi:hypothetical protein